MVRREKGRRAAAIPPSIQQQALYLVQQQKQQGTSAKTSHGAPSQQQILQVAKGIAVLDDRHIPGSAFPDTMTPIPQLSKYHPHTLIIRTHYSNFSKSIEQSPYHIPEHDGEAGVRESGLLSLKAFEACPQMNIPDELISAAGLRNRKLGSACTSRQQQKERELQDSLWIEGRESGLATAQDDVSFMAQAMMHTMVHDEEAEEHQQEEEAELIEEEDDEDETDYQMNYFDTGEDDGYEDGGGGGGDEGKFRACMHEYITLYLLNRTLYGYFALEAYY